MIYCKRCQGKIVMHAFSDGVCEVCSDDIYCSHAPANLVCHNCAEDFNLCESCGKNLKDEEDL